MIEPILSLALSVQANPGVYAILLGSGVSRAAGIPTGWEVVLDLIRRLARLRGEDPEPDPAEWYRVSFHEEPDYSRLLDAVAKSPAERQQLLRVYFEPNDEEREEGLKLPTAAHRAVASLISKGYVRVVVTTNFDRLLERALEEVGVTPTVIDTADKVDGAMPIVHSACTVVKIHGEYLDTRIRNTPEELDSYPEALDRLLDRVLDEFGLVLCGWSAEWDTALRACIERCPTRRFTTYWAAFGDPAGAAKRLIEHRRGVVVPIKGADAFFSELLEKVESLESINVPHPLSARVAAETAKRLLSEPRHRIRLHDLLTDATEHLIAEVSTFPTDDASDTVFQDQVARYEAVTKPLWTLFATGCFWGDESHNRLWTLCVERLARSAEDTRAGHEKLTKLRRYPAMLCMYAGGIAAVAAENYRALRALLIDARSGERRYEASLVWSLNSHNVMDRDEASKLFGGRDLHTPVNDRIHNEIREAFHSVLPDDLRYTAAFDRFEYLFSLIYADMKSQQQSFSQWIPIGSFMWRDRDPQTGLAARIRNEIQSAGAAWPLLQIGLFDGSPERALQAVESTEAHATRVRDSRGLW
jgi:hypothetical protein